MSYGEGVFVEKSIGTEKNGMTWPHGGLASPETRARISSALKGNKRALGYKHTAEVRAGLGLALKGNKRRLGKKHSAETCAKMSKAHKGKPKSPEQRANMSIGQKKRFADPSRHTRWMGGISREPYAWEFNAELKEEVRRRDGYRCQLCGVPQAECGTKLSVHHMDYDKKNSDPVNLASLCHACHSKTNANRTYWTTFFQEKALSRARQGLLF